MAQKRNDPTELRELARKLAQSATSELTKLGNVLVAIKDARLYLKYRTPDGDYHTNWEVFVASEIEVPVGLSYKLMDIARWASFHKLSLAQSRSLNLVGVTKAHILTEVADKSSIVDWIEEARPLTAEGLRELVFKKRGACRTKSVGFHIRRGSAEHRLERALRLARSAFQDPDAATRGDLLDELAESYIAREKRLAASN